MLLIGARKLQNSLAHIWVERKVDRKDGALAQFALNLNPAVIERIRMF